MVDFSLQVPPTSVILTPPYSILVSKRISCTFCKIVDRKINGWVWARYSLPPGIRCISLIKFNQEPRRGSGDSYVPIKTVTHFFFLFKILGALQEWMSVSPLFTAARNPLHFFDRCHWQTSGSRLINKTTTHFTLFYWMLGALQEWMSVSPLFTAARNPLHFFDRDEVYAKSLTWYVHFQWRCVHANLAVCVDCFGTIGPMRSESGWFKCGYLALWGPPPGLLT